MEKIWNYNGVNYVLKKATYGYGQYILNGYHFTNSEVWDYVDNDEDIKKQENAMRVAEAFIKTKY